MPSKEIEIGPISAHPIGEEYREDTSTGKFRGEACVRLYEVSGPGFDLRVGDLRFVNLDRDVRVVSRLTSPELWDRLVRGFRVGVERHRGDRYKMRVRIPAIGNKPYPTLHQATVDEIASTCELDAFAVLKPFGVEGLGPASQVLGSTGRAAKELYVTFTDPDGTSVAPVATFLVSPVMTFWKRFALTA